MGRRVVRFASLILFAHVLPHEVRAATIGLAWDPVPDATITRYVVHYGTRSGDYTSSIDTGLSTGWFVTGLADNTRVYFVVQACNAFGCSEFSNEVNGVTFTPTPLLTNDFSGDERSELTVWRPGSGTWFSRVSDGNFSGSSQLNWGASGDIPVAGDYDGDGRADAAVWRPGNGRWYVRFAAGGTLEMPWGSGGLNDVPVAADYDGDGRTDLAVWRPGNATWYVMRSSANNTSSFAINWGSGALGDVPLPADFDGDGRADIAVWRPSNGQWYIRTSGSNYTNTLTRQWGSGTLRDVPVPGDFDGDSRADIAVWRPNSNEAVWYVLTSRSNYAQYFTRSWGAGSLNDVPVIGDFDGDSTTDLTVWRPGNGVWYILNSSTGYSSYDAIGWGAGSLGDIPIGAARNRR